MMKIKFNINHILLLVLTIIIGARGVFPSLLYEGGIWLICFYFVLKEGFHRIYEIIDNNKWMPFYLLSFLVFSVSVLLSNNVSAFKIFYNFILFIPFLIIFSKLERVNIFVNYSCVFICLTSCLLMLHTVGGSDFSSLFHSRSGIRRAVGFMGNPNYFAYYCFSIFILSSYILPVKKRIFFSLFIIIAIILSISRGVLIGLILFLSIALLRTTKSIVLSVILVSILSVSILDFLPETLLDSISARMGDEGGSGRSMIWKEGYESWSKSSKDVFFGFGFNNFQKRVMLGKQVENTVHNSYLRVLFEFGVYGFIILFTFYLKVFLSAKWDNKRAFMGFLFPMAVCWLTNDFFLLKETFYLVAILLSLPVIKYGRVKKSHNLYMSGL